MPLYKLYGVYGPNGNLVEVCPTSWEAKVAVFDCQDSDFRNKYWKKEGPAWRAAKKMGWKIEIGAYQERLSAAIVAAGKPLSQQKTRLSWKCYRS